MNVFKCSKCESTHIFMKKNGNQTGLYCANCGKWIKWMTKEEIRLHEEKVKTECTDKIQCASCGYLGDESEWYGTVIHTKVKCCPKCGTLRYIHENNKGFRK